MSDGVINGSEEPTRTIVLTEVTPLSQQLLIAQRMFDRQMARALGIPSDRMGDPRPNASWPDLADREQGK